MKKHLIFIPALVIISVLLALLKTTGMTAHIIISVAGVLVLAAYTVATKKEWKIPALEIVLRACYAIALISGIIIINIHGIAFLSILHKVTAGLFVGLLIVVTIHKFVAKKA